MTLVVIVQSAACPAFGCLIRRGGYLTPLARWRWLDVGIVADSLIAKYGRWTRDGHERELGQDRSND